MSYVYTNPDLDPKNKLIGIYNVMRVADSKPEILVSDYNFSLPQPYSGPKSPNNTLVVITPKPFAPSYGTINLYYNRIDLSELVGFSIEKESATTVLGILDKINEELGVELTPLDVSEAALPNAGSSFTLTVTDECLIFYGSTSIDLI